MSDELRLSDAEMLFVAQAFYNKVGEMVNTKDPDNLRGRVSDAYKELYETTGAKSFDAKLLGQKVGTFSVTVSKPTESTSSTTLEITDKQALYDWASVNGYLQVDMDKVLANFEQTGEVPDGCEPLEVVHPGDPGGLVTRTSLKVDAESVASVLGPQLETVSYMMLEGGE